MRHWLAVALAALVLQANATLGSPQVDAKKAADEFYKASLSVKSIHVAGIPPAKIRSTLTPNITPQLDKLLAEGDRIEEKHEKETKNQEPPFLEGDIFSSNFEGVTTYKIGDCIVKDDVATCPVALTYTDPRDKKGPSWTDTLLLTRTNGAWKVDDVEYGGNWDFSNRGKLSDTLKALIKDEGK